MRPCVEFQLSIILNDSIIVFLSPAQYKYIFFMFIREIVEFMDNLSLNVMTVFKNHLLNEYNQVEVIQLKL